MLKATLLEKKATADDQFFYNVTALEAHLAASHLETHPEQVTLSPL